MCCYVEAVGTIITTLLLRPQLQHCITSCCLHTQLTVSAHTQYFAVAFCSASITVGHCGDFIGSTVLLYKNILMLRLSEERLSVY